MAPITDSQISEIILFSILVLSCGKKDDPVYKGKSLIEYSIDQTIKA